MWLRVVVRGPVGGYPRILPCSCCLGLPLSVDVWVGRCFGGGGEFWVAFWLPGYLRMFMFV